MAVNDGEGEILKDGIVYYPKPLANHCFWRQMKIMEEFRYDIGLWGQGVDSEVMVMVIYGYI
jgi:hypothetical protein